MQSASVSDCVSKGDGCDERKADRNRIVKVRDVLKILRSEGWILTNQECSPRQFVHPDKPGKVTVAGHESDKMPPKTMKSKMKQADIS